jgi:glucose/arabinose dehydrogenase
MKKITLLFAMLLGATITQSQNNQLPKLRLQDFSEGYDQPIGIENAGDSRLFIVEQGGKIWICDTTGKKSDSPFLNISDRVTHGGFEQGLLGLAFDPNYSVNGYFYVNYTNDDGNTRVSRFSVKPNNPDKADKNSEVVLIKQHQPFINHNGGCMRFSEGYLYVSFGDGGDAADPFNNAQNPGTLLGKIIRIDVTHGSNGKNYAIPPTNPFVAMSGYRPEIWATGLRNPWRFSFDDLNDNMWVADVGQDEWEEINFQPAGEGGLNYGWSCWEGAHFFKNNCNANNTPPTFPIAEYEHIVSPGCGGTVIGGFVYRGSQFPKMYGKYIYTDYCTGIIRTVYKDHGVWVNRYLTTEEPLEYTAFGEDINGELYLSDIGDGEIYKVVDSSAISPRISSGNSFTAVQNGDNISLYPNPNTGLFTVQITAPQKESYLVTISNQLGQEILSEKKTVDEGLNEWTFSSEKFIKGVYVIQFRTSEGIINKKFSVN